MSKIMKTAIQKLKDQIADMKEMLSCPGDTIIETLVIMEISNEKFSILMEMPEEKINFLLIGIDPLTPATAKKLEAILKIDFQFWINREAIYRKKIKQIKELEEEYIRLTGNPEFIPLPLSIECSDAFITKKYPSYLQIVFKKQDALLFWNSVLTTAMNGKNIFQVSRTDNENGFFTFKVGCDDKMFFYHLGFIMKNYPFFE